MLKNFISKQKPGTFVCLIIAFFFCCIVKSVKMLFKQLYLFYCGDETALKISKVLDSTTSIDDLPLITNNGVITSLNLYLLFITTLILFLLILKRYIITLQNKTGSCSLLSSNNRLNKSSLKWFVLSKLAFYIF